MLRRRLYLQIYGTIIASLVTVVVLTGLLWNLFGRNGPDHDATEVIGQLALLALPAAQAPLEQQRSA
ncbi:MAG: hypothetical protein ACR2OM_08485, partial [Aestuariivirgaceae bacterium]